MDQELLNSVFRAYDVRGKYPSELSPEFYYHLGRAYVTRFSPKKIAVGHDIRPESLELKHSLIEGVLDSGCDVTDIGEIGTDMLYFAVGEYYQLFDGGLVVTASHNPAGWNGCKMVKKNVQAIIRSTGLDDIKEIMLKQNYASGQKGTVDELDIYPAYKEKVLSFIKSSKRKELNIVVDAGNGIGGKLFDYVFGELDLNVTKLFFVIDGTYPNHVPNPLIEANVAELKRKVLSEDADFGIATDGDADRTMFVDKKGRRPDGAYTGVLLAKHLLSRSDSKKVIHDPRITWPFVKECAKLGATTAVSIAGNAFFKKVMLEEDAVFGAEVSAHFFYKDFYYADSGMVTIALMLDMYFEGFDLTKELDYLFEMYPNSGEVNYRIEDPDALLEQLKKTYGDQGGQISEIDGVSVEFSDWRFNIRRSQTESLVRLNVEAKDKNTVVEKFTEVEKIIGAERENQPALPELQ